MSSPRWTSAGSCARALKPMHASRMPSVRTIRMHSAMRRRGGQCMRAFACVLALSILLAGAAQAAPRRVASLNLCTDELLLSLADPEQIASVTYLAQQPEESTLWRQARAYPKNDGSLISVVRYRPDLVVTMGGGGRDSARIAQRLGIQML